MRWFRGVGTALLAAVLIASSVTGHVTAAAAVQGADPAADASICPRDSAADARFVHLAYRNVLGREASDGEAAYWAATLDYPTSFTYTQLAQGLTGSLEFRATVVRGLYVTILHREVDPSGLVAWSNLLASHAQADVASSLLGSSEYWNAAGGTATGWVTAVYRDVLGRTPDAAGLTYWVGMLAAGTVTRAGIATALWQSREHRSTRVDTTYRAILGRSADQAGASYWTTTLASHDDAWLVDNLVASAEFWALAQRTFGGTSTTQPPVCPKPCTPAVVGSWPLATRLGQLLTIGVDPTGDAQIAVNLAQIYGIGGIDVRSGSLSIYSDSRLHGLATTRGIPVFVGTDEEGGRVDRLASLLGPIPSARTMAATMTPTEVHDLAQREGVAMRALGLNVDWAPVADVSDQLDHGPIGNRSFSNDPATVATYSGAFAQGLRDAGILPVIKHFPGQGHAVGDSHVGAATTPPLAWMQTHDLVPYTSLLATSPTAVMVGHLTVPGLTTAALPASVNGAAINGLLRHDLHFGGVVFTDSLDMDSITSTMTASQAATRAIAAGADEAMFASPVDVGSLIAQLEANVASGALPESAVNTSVARVLAAKSVRTCG